MVFKVFSCGLRLCGIRKRFVFYIYIYSIYIYICVCVSVCVCVCVCVRVCIYIYLKTRNLEIVFHFRNKFISLIQAR